MQTASLCRSFRCLISLIGFAAFVLSASAQETQPPSQCPSFSVSCPAAVEVNEDIKFIATITGDKFDGLTLKWSISAGKIIEGQGTPTLVVRRDNECQTLTATIEVYGLPSGCARSASCTICIDCCWTLPALKFAEYGDVSCEQEQTHLDSFKQQLDNQPGARGYIIFYGGRLYDRRLPRRDESEARSIRIRSYAPFREWIESERVVIVNGGFRESWNVELWIVPAGSMGPQMTPTIDADALKFRPGAVRKDEYKCRL